MRIATILVVVAALQGCGQKGPLSLPSAHIPILTPAPAMQLPDPQNPGTPSSPQSP